MPASLRFRSLVQRTREIYSRFVPPIDALGNYDDAAYDRMRGYRLLVHAEIEAFIEDRCCEVAQAAVEAWAAARTPTEAMTALVAFYTGCFPAVPTERNAPMIKGGAVDSLDSRLSLACTSYNAIVRRGNNGVKEKDLLPMLLPIGVRADDLDQAWLSDMSSFGRGRGSVAHQAKHTQQPIDPATERKAVGRLIWGLRHLDTLLNSLMP